MVKTLNLLFEKNQSTVYRYIQLYNVTIRSAFLEINNSDIA